MKKCPKCNKERTIGDYCYACGSKLVSEEVEYVDSAAHRAPGFEFWFALVVANVGIMFYNIEMYSRFRDEIFFAVVMIINMICFSAPPFVYVWWSERRK